MTQAGVRDRQDFVCEAVVQNAQRHARHDVVDFGGAGIVQDALQVGRASMVQVEAIVLESGTGLNELFFDLDAGQAAV